MSKHAWDTVKLGILVSPFWFLAGNLTDGDELVKTMTGVAMLAGANLLPKLKDRVKSK